jgi:hypothetical protein
LNETTKAVHPKWLCGGRLPPPLAQHQWKGQTPVTSGKHEIVYDYTYDGPGIGNGGTGVLKVDGEVLTRSVRDASCIICRVIRRG